MLKVTAAVIRDGDKILLCQRPENKRHGLLWEFPGGKVEPGETEEACIVRECNEELSVILGKIKKLTTIEADDISISYFEAVIESGILKKNEHNDIRWINPKDINSYKLCPNDRAMVDKVTL